VPEHHRHWTVEEANAALGYVGMKIDRLRELIALMEAPEAERGYAVAGVESGGGWPGREPAAAAVEVALIMQVLERLDIVIRDLDRGLIDFPSLRGGEEVYLCWLRDEPRVTHWHDPAGGFAGRRPL
jgi:Uncharacterized conserved protein (DUF2203)